jgi:cytochrome c-type biogenesis protein CcmH/NrfG
MKLKDLHSAINWVLLMVNLFLLIKLFGTPENWKQPQNNQAANSLNSYKSQIAELQRLLLVSNNERDSIQKLRNKIKIKYEKEYEIYLVKDSIARGNYTILPIYHNKDHNLWKTTLHPQKNH